MKFGKEFHIHLEETLPEWRDKFLCYKPLKKLLKRFPNRSNDSSITSANQVQPPPRTQDVVGGSDPRDNMSLAEFQEWFVRLLNEELEKFNDFYVDKEEEFVIRFQELKERIERVKERGVDGVSSRESKFSEEMMEIRKEFVSIHGEMVLLQNYSSLNFAGLVKILKKYDKRTGGVLQLPFTQLAVHQPFFTTEPLMRLVCECESNIELLFPLEEEVTESTSTAPRDDITNVSSLSDTTQDIYRSTLSAMRTIQGLRTSSTYNPLSFASLFRNQEEEGSGAVTEENSPCSSAPSPKRDDTDSAP